MRPAFLLSLGALAVGAQAAEPVVLGRLGQTKTAAQIFSAPSAKGRVLSRVNQGVYLVVKPGGGKWATIVMKDRRLGYVPSQAIETLAYEVTESGTRSVAAPRGRRSSAGYVASRSASVPRVSGDARASMAAYATQWEGTTPYKWGGTELGTGIDCSGFVRKMAGAIGMHLPRTAAEQAQVGQPIMRYEDLRQGDRLYFWDAKRGKIGHCGIYLGGGYFTHSSSGHKGIARDYLSARWQKICVAARR